jgi:hypothetical protein
MYQWCRVVLTALIAICVSALAVAQSIERKPGTEIHANAYSEVTVQSYQECEQRCLADNTCTALEYYKEQPSKQCGLHSKVGKLGPKSTVDVGIKVAGSRRQIPVVAGSFERRENTETYTDTYTDATLGSYEECEQMCLADDRCKIAEYYKDRTSKQCGLHETVGQLAAKSNVVVGIKRAGVQATLRQSPPTPIVAAPESSLEDEGTIWKLNDSTLVLTIDDDDVWTFRYLSPRPGMVEEGVKRGTVLFKGKTDGERIWGTAYRFSKRCGPLPYEVSGEFELDGILLLRGTGASGTDLRCIVTKWTEYSIDINPT